MKWFKHPASSGDSQFIRYLIDQHGLEGYAMFWLILEDLADNFDPAAPDARIWLNISKIRSKTGATFAKILKLFHTLSSDFNKFPWQIAITKDQKMIGIYSPKLKELADEYTVKMMRSKVGTKSEVAPEQEVEVEVEEEREYKDIPYPYVYRGKMLEVGKRDHCVLEKKFPDYHLDRIYIDAGEWADRTLSEGVVSPVSFITRWVRNNPDVNKKSRMDNIDDALYRKEFGLEVDDVAP